MAKSPLVPNILSLAETDSRCYSQEYMASTQWSFPRVLLPFCQSSGVCLLLADKTVMWWIWLSLPGVILCTLTRSLAWLLTQIQKPCRLIKDEYWEFGTNLFPCTSLKSMQFTPFLQNFLCLENLSQKNDVSLFQQLCIFSSRALHFRTSETVRQPTTSVTVQTLNNVR